MRRYLFLLFALSLAPLAPALAARSGSQDPTPAPDRIVPFKMTSSRLSQYWGREIVLEAAVVLPRGDAPEGGWPACYDIHGFGGNHRAAFFWGPQLIEQMDAGRAPAMLYVFLNAQCPMGHHEFADSANNGPWGEALVTELVPALEREFSSAGTSLARFLTGHSSGGWSALWLQITYPDFFGGAWAMAPDPVDFRDFTGIDIYTFDNAYADAGGREIMLIRRGAEWMVSLRDYAQREFARRAYGGQFASFNAVFSPRGDDGTPMKLFDPESGTIDRFVAKAWEKYDISLVLRRHWQELAPRLAGKLHIYVGSLDTFGLERAVILLQKELAALGSDAEIVIVEGRDHGSLLAPHPELWPEGLLTKVHRKMAERFEKARAAAPLRPKRAD
ncbi:MAG: alpha/beta hydrolase-fold protein [Planctomycetota bacterium]